MRIERFEDILAWQRAKQLTIEVYVTFKGLKDYGFRDQIERASVSIMNNIAEGFERGGDKEFSHFLYIAKGSCGELRSMLHLAIELGYLQDDRSRIMLDTAEEISRILSGLITSLKPSSTTL